MTLAAVLVLVVLVPLTAWAWRARPGRDAQQEFADIWRRGPWGKQLIVDFYGLEVVLALFMITHASAHGTGLLAALCILTMPVFGAMSAAAYWLAAVA